MDKILYLGFSVIYTILGFLSIDKRYKNFALKAFFILSVSLPIVNFTQRFHIKNQISIFNFFFIGIYIYYTLKVVYHFHLKKRLIGGITVTLILLFFYTIHFFVLVQESRAYISILKDIKPFLTIITAYLFIDYFKESMLIVLKEKYIIKLLVINFIVSTAFYYLMKYHNIQVVLSGDAYYKYNELRYLSLGTYFCVFYILSNVVRGNIPKIKYLFISIIPLFYTGNRTLIITLVITVIISILIKQNLKKIIIFLIGTFILAIAFLLSVKYSLETSGLYRFKELTDLNSIIAALSNRISPFTIGFKETRVHEFFLGKGLGFSFFIPWFEYRVNIDNYNIYLDNLYLTLYAKYGIFSIVFFILINDYLKSFTENKMQIFIYSLFFLLLSLTNAIVYQYYFLWFLIMLVFPFFMRSDDKKLLV